MEGPGANGATVRPADKTAVGRLRYVSISCTSPLLPCCLALWLPFSAIIRRARMLSFLLHNNLASERKMCGNIKFIVVNTSILYSLLFVNERYG